MKAAENGDANAWAMLISRFRGHVARVARSYGLNAHQVDDVAQETWLRLYRHIGSVRDPHALGAWLGTTASRESLRALAGDAPRGADRRGAVRWAPRPPTTSPTRWRAASAARRSSARWRRSRRATAR